MSLSYSYYNIEPTDTCDDLYDMAVAINNNNKFPFYNVHGEYYNPTDTNNNKSFSAKDPPKNMRNGSDTAVQQHSVQQHSVQQHSDTKKCNVCSRKKYNEHLTRNSNKLTQELKELKRIKRMHIKQLQKMERMNIKKVEERMDVNSNDNTALFYIIVGLLAGILVILILDMLYGRKRK
jgi:tRNA uridine 5-carbamoylmethylation protein Kti12